MEHLNFLGMIFLLIMVGPVVFCLSRKAPQFIRRVPGIDALEIALSTAVERGRPVVFTTGTASVGPLLYACLEVLKFLAKKAAIYKTKLFIPCNDPEAMVLTQTTFEQAYKEAGRLDQFDPTTIRFLSDEQFAYSSGYMGLVHRENVGAAFLLGSFAAESLILAEAGRQVDAFQVAGTTSSEQIPFFVTACDYTLIGEEVFAAGAYLSKDPLQSASLRGQDIAKCGLLFLILFWSFEQTILSFLGLSSGSLHFIKQIVW